MKRPSPLIRRDSSVDLDAAMTPMIDVVFLLLVFFVWTASFHVIELILPSELSSQLGTEQIENLDPPPEKDFEDVVVRIGWNGTSPDWSINGQPIESLEALRDSLTVISKINQTPVILHPQPVVPLGYVIEAYDVAKLSGFAKVSFAVNPQGL